MQTMTATHLKTLGCVVQVACRRQAFRLQHQDLRVVVLAFGVAYGFRFGEGLEGIAVETEVLTKVKHQLGD